MKMENKVLIFGHKNPDTDSICASLVNEILEKKNGNNNVEARRLGNVNKETIIRKSRRRTRSSSSRP